MSKSVRRVELALAAAGLPGPIVEMEGDCTTAASAAATLGVEVDRIAKSILFVGAQSDAMVLFVTAGSNRVAPEIGEALAEEGLARPDAAMIRARTGFAIGGVAPLGHLCEVRAFFDIRLLDFATVWSAAGTPRHVFEADPGALAQAIGAKTAALSQ